MATALLVWGGGGHGRVVADAARAAGFVLAGFVDADPDKRGAVVEPGGGRVVASEEELRAALAAGRLPAGADAVALAVGDNARRWACLAALGDAPCPAVVHPSAVVSPSATLGRGTVVFAGVVVNAAARVGSAVILNTRAVVEHDCRVGDAAHLSPGAVLCGGASAGARAWVGAGATVIHGGAVGDDAVVGAGAVVVRPVPDGVTVVGNPARVIQRSGDA